MVVHDYNLANQTPASYRTDHNTLNTAIVSNNASSSGITTTYAHMWYTDVSSSGWVRRRNAADSTANYYFKTDADGGLCTYAGSPSTNHIGRYVGQMLWDTSNSRYYACTLAGTSSSATWSMIASSSAYNSAGFPNGYIAGPPPTYNSATQVIIPAGLKLRDAGNAADITFSTAYTIDITVAGAGGLSTDLTESSSSWYNLFAIRKSADGTINGILTTATSAPTLPSGYDQYRMLPFAVRNSSAGDFWAFTVDEGWPHRPMIRYNTVIGVTGSVGNHNVLSGGNSTQFTNVSGTASEIPSISRRAEVKMQATYSTASGTLRIRNDGESHEGQMVGVATAQTNGYLMTTIPVSTQQIFEYRVDTIGVTGSLWVNGFVVTEVY